MRLRRELRSLPEAERERFFGALQVMRNTTLVEGRARFGAAYRSFDLLLLKHATAALGRCKDEGHSWRNQIMFHRALLLEFEGSMLAVVEALWPASALRGVPYWDVSIDVAAKGDWWSGSLFKYWGSAFGDVDDDYCISDPYFRTEVPTWNTTEEPVRRLAQKIFGAAAPAANAYGFMRSPWNPSRCRGLARNPGWVFNAPFARPLRLDACLGSASWAGFASCLQGSGFTAHGPDFGLHNLPHVTMGTFADEAFLAQTTSEVAFAVCAAIAMLLFLAGVSRRSRVPLLATLAVAALWLARTFRPVGSGTYWHAASSWVQVVHDRGSIALTGQEWRQGHLTCPLPGECSLELPASACSACRRTVDGYAPAFVGSDFWDGAFSPNEHFFWSLHAYVDLQAVRFMRRTDVQALPEQAPGCRDADVEVLEDVSPEFCFTLADIGVLEDQSQGSGNSSVLGGSARDSVRATGGGSSATGTAQCLAHADLLRLSRQLGDPSALYSFDVLQDEYSWVAVEPEAACRLEDACFAGSPPGGSAGSPPGGSAGSPSRGSAGSPSGGSAGSPRARSGPTSLSGSVRPATGAARGAMRGPGAKARAADA